MASRAYVTELEDRAPHAFEWTARVLYEQLNGQGTWTNADPEQRSYARLCVRQMLATLAKHGLRVDDRRANQPPLPFPSRLNTLQKRRA